VDQGLAEYHLASAVCPWVVLEAPLHL
jgi:hypothetical protein